MFLSREARDAAGCGGCKRSYLNTATVVIFTRDDGCSRPCLCAVSGRKRTAAVKEFAALSTVCRPRALGDFFQSSVDDHAVNRRLCDEQSRFPGSRIVVLATEQIKTPGHRADAIS